MKILVDGDGCPVIRQVETAARKHQIPVTILCDTNHMLVSDYSEIKIIGDGMDAVDYALINLCEKGDIVVTQDYGVACMALLRKAYGIHQSGFWYTEDTIDQLLYQRHMARVVRQGSKKKQVKGPKKRTKEDDMKFLYSLEKLIAKWDETIDRRAK